METAGPVTDRPFCHILLPGRQGGSIAPGAQGRPCPEPQRTAWNWNISRKKSLPGGPSCAASGSRASIWPHSRILFVVLLSGSCPRTGLSRRGVVSWRNTRRTVSLFWRKPSCIQGSRSWHSWRPTGSSAVPCWGRMRSGCWLRRWPSCHMVTGIFRRCFWEG